MVMVMVICPEAKDCDHEPCCHGEPHEKGAGCGSFYHHIKESVKCVKHEVEDTIEIPTKYKDALINTIENALPAPPSFGVCIGHESKQVVCTGDSSTYIGTTKPKPTIEDLRELLNIIKGGK